jgi:hypothetical protein
MSNEEPRVADEPEPQADPSAPAKPDPKELVDDELQSVSGGLMSTGGATLRSGDTATCISQL